MSREDSARHCSAGRLLVLAGHHLCREGDDVAPYRICCHRDSAVLHLRGGVEVGSLKNV